MQEYTVFISYRHKKPDITVAKAIHSKLENFVIPALIRKATGVKKIGRCFRDQEELPTSSDLAQDIVDALTNSQWLVVVCTPDTPHSKWCLAEIETFIKLHGRSRVLAVLAAGEPEESFPEILRYETVADGSRVEREPLAADLRSKSTFLMKRKLNVEKFRILAPILGVAFDDLRRRARERFFKIALTASAAAVVVLAMFGAYVSYQASIISRQNDELEIQIAETDRQRRLAVSNEEEAKRQANISMLGQLDLLCELSKNAVAAGDRIAGVHWAVDSADIYDKLFPTGNTEKEEDIRRTLEGAVYSRSFQLLTPLKTNNRKLGYAEYSPDNRFILCGVGGFTAALIDAYTGEVLSAVTRSRPHMDNELAFLSFSPSGEYFVTGFGSFSCEIIVWKTGMKPKEEASIHVQENSVGGYFLSEKEVIFGRLGGIDEPVIWDFTTGATGVPDDAQKNAFRLNSPHMASGGSESESLLSPDGVYRYAGGADIGDPVRIYETASSRCIGQIEEAEIVYAISHDGHRLIAGNAAGFCGIYSTMDSATTVISTNSKDPIYQYPNYFDVEHSENLILNSSHYYDTSIYGWTQPYMLNEPSGKFVAMVYPDSYVAVWDLEKDRVDATYIFFEHIGAISAAFMTREYLVTAGLDGRLMVFRLSDGTFMNNTAVENGIVALNLDTTGTKAVVVGRSLMSVYVYDLNTGLLIYRIDAEPGDSIDHSNVGFSEDGSQIIVRTKSGRTIIGELFFTLEELRAIATDMYPQSIG